MTLASTRLLLIITIGILADCHSQYRHITHLSSLTSQQTSPWNTEVQLCLLEYSQRQEARERGGTQEREVLQCVYYPCVFAQNEYEILPSLQRRRMKLFWEANSGWRYWTVLSCDVNYAGSVQALGLKYSPWSKDVYRDQQQTVKNNRHPVFPHFLQMNYLTGNFWAASFNNIYTDVCQGVFNILLLYEAALTDIPIIMVVQQIMLSWCS